MWIAGCPLNSSWAQSYINFCQNLKMFFTKSQKCYCIHCERYYMNPVIWKGLSGGGQLTKNWDAIFLGIGEGCNRVLWTEGVKEMSFKTYLKEKVTLDPKLWPISHGDLAPSRDFLGFPLINERSFIMGNPSWEQGCRGKSVITLGPVWRFPSNKF